MANRNHIWDKMAKSFHKMSSSSVVLRDRYERIARIILKSKPHSILNLGCGSGLLEYELIKNGFSGKIIGVDASAEMIKLAKLQCRDKADFIQADLNEPLKLSEKFDVVVAMNVMFFLEDDRKFLKSICGMLNSDSIFILINPKSNEESSILHFIKDHFKNTSIREKILISLNEITNLPSYWNMIMGQAKIWRMSNNGEIIFHKREGIMELAREVGLSIEIVEDYRESQSWLFVMRSNK